MSEDKRAPPSTIDRATLYEQVWATPLLALAKTYGISNVALGKICKKLNVPTPGVGYWARVQHGAKIERPQLPPLQTGQPTEVTLASRAPKEGGADVPKERKEPAPLVEVPETLHGAHPVALLLKRELERRTPDKNYGGVLVIRGGPPSPVRVTRNCESRLLRIASALFKALEVRGHRVSLDRMQHRAPLKVQIRDQGIAIGLHEHFKQLPHVLTPEESASKRQGGYFFAPKFDYSGTGSIDVVVGESWQRARGTWRERSRPLEADLGNVVLRLEHAADTLEAQERANAEWRRRMDEADEQRRRAELDAQHLRFLAQDLEQMSERAEKAARIRTFLEAARPLLEGDDRPDTSRWLAWASAYAEQIDPLRNPERIAKAMTPSSAAQR